jgi:hypothetical protein
VSIEEVRSLVAERQRYDDWLAALDARKAETPERVYARVRGDYDARRGEVLTKLAEHVAELEMLSGKLQQQRSELSTQLDALEEQRVEAMIRNAVGEYDNDKWDALRAEVEGQITRLTDDRSLVQMELDEIHALLEQARPASVAAPEPEPEPTPEPVVEASPEPESVEAEANVEAHVEAPSSTAVDATVAETAADAPSAATGDMAAEVTEEFIAVDIPAEGAADISADTVEMAVFTLPESDTMTPAPAATGDALPELVTVAEGVDIIDEAPFVVPEADAPFVNSEVDDALAMFAETPVQPMAAVPEPQAPAASAPAAPNVPPIDPFDDLAFLHSVIAPSGSQPAVPAATVTPPSVPAASNSAEPAKTLRCTECGTMNLPTEWYCERCGGELAAF